VLGLFLIARMIGGSGAGEISARTRRRLERASARDAARYERRSNRAQYTMVGETNT
jgi:hypothetical protein